MVVHAARSQANVRQEIIIEQSNRNDGDHVIERNVSEGSAPRNRFGSLVDRGDRALERIDEDHPGLGDDAITERSQRASQQAQLYHQTGQPLLNLEVNVDGSFVDANSDDVFIGSELGNPA